MKTMWDVNSMSTDKVLLECNCLYQFLHYSSRAGVVEAETICPQSLLCSFQRKLVTSDLRHGT